MSFLLPIVVFSVPVLAIVTLALFGRRLAGSCGGQSPDGRCNTCGRLADSKLADGGKQCP